MTPVFELQCWVKKLYRQGGRFHKHLDDLELSEHLSPEALQTMQNRRFQHMIRHCVENVPYYRELFQQLKLGVDDVQTPADLVKLPVLDKQTVNQNFDRLIARNRKNWLCQVAKTSGTTGSPAQFIRDFNSINFENAAIWREWRRAGDYGKRRVSLRGWMVTPVAQTEPPFWRYNPANQEVQMSSFHLSIKNSKAYVDEILKFRPQILYCLPSLGALLGKFFVHHGIDYKFDAIFTSSESLEPDTREFLEQTFHARVNDWYGQTERVAAIGQCELGSYHIQEDYSIVELLPGCDSGTYELIGTHLHNFVMPLLRYRTNDYVTAGNEPCECGSAFRRVGKILGRSGKTPIITPEGCHITITAHITCGIDNLLETQFTQERPGEVILKIVTNGQFNERDQEQLIRNAKQYTSPLMKVEVQKVDEIPRGPNGKFISIINTSGVERQGSLL